MEIEVANAYKLIIVALGRV